MELVIGTEFSIKLWLWRYWRFLMSDRLFLPGVSMACNWSCGLYQILSSIESFMFYISVVELVGT